MLDRITLVAHGRMSLRQKKMRNQKVGHPGIKKMDQP